MQEPIERINNIEAAVARGDMASVMRLKLNCSQSDLSKAVMRAAEDGKIKIFNELLNPQRPLDSLTLEVALADACKNGHTEIAGILLDNFQADPCLDYGHAAQKASYHGRMDPLQMLLANPQGKKSILAAFADILKNASEKGHLQIVELLLQLHKQGFSKASKESDAKLFRALNAATETGRIEILSLLLAACSENLSGIQCKELLGTACTTMNSEVVQILLSEKRVTLENADLVEGFEAVCRNGDNVKIIGLFFQDKRFHPTLVQVDKILRLAILHGCAQIIGLFLEHIFENKNMNIDFIWKAGKLTNSIFHLATERVKPEVLKPFLKYVSHQLGDREFSKNYYERFFNPEQKHKSWLFMSTPAFQKFLFFSAELPALPKDIKMEIAKPLMSLELKMKGTL